MAGRWSDIDSSLKRNVSKKFLLYVIQESIIAASEALSQRLKILPVSNAIPRYDIQLGKNVDELTWTIGFWDRCSSMNTVNIIVHQLITTQHLHIVEKYEQFDDRYVFEPIKLSCAV